MAGEKNYVKIEQKHYSLRITIAQPTTMAPTYKLNLMRKKKKKKRNRKNTNKNKMRELVKGPSLNECEGERKRNGIVGKMARKELYVHCVLLLWKKDGLSARLLLNSKADPRREQVRWWFLIKSLCCFVRSHPVPPQNDAPPWPVGWGINKENDKIGE